ncbi:MAG: FHA domain-containing protein [Anaerolineaceae bacterium]|nr:FHA domain-containing protein [Anaerolineaceae bacterium]
MNQALILFALRAVSGLLLLTILLGLFVVIWKEFRSAAEQTAPQRKIYGRLNVLREIDGSYRVTGETYPLLPLTSLGRSPTNSIPIPDTFASSEHALVTLRDGQWWLEDRQSRNGTTLNDLPVKQPVVITHGDFIGIGTVRFHVELES